MNTPTETSSCTGHECCIGHNQPRLTGALVLLLAMTAGLAVANVYVAQPLLDSMAHSLGVAPARIGVVVTVTQIGYALGLIFLVPLGDLIDQRKLILGQMLLSVAFLTFASLVERFALLLAALALVGLMAVVVQVVVAFGASLAAPAEQGRVVGRITSGIVLGILLARLVSGVVSDLAGWRAVYALSAALMLLMVMLLGLRMPRHSLTQAGVSYWALLGSVVELFLTEPVLRARAVLAMLVFASFSILWTSLVLPLSVPDIGYSHTQIGLFGLAGIAGALAASQAGRRADQGRGQQTTGVALVLLLLSWIPMAYLEASILWLVLGIIVLDFAVQAVHVTNQSMILAARPDASSRLIGGYMVFYSLGSALGAVSSTTVYGWAGWAGVCLLGASVSMAALLFWSFTRSGMSVHL
ncbi:putative MFS family arabinose efflux permease [Pseudomonas duriflava]|uniref:Putative MFS family arabinose efflux permease n=1 Tax=Pseudomonas duriflava TaxID=459528 RepID=A0A562PX29_9PSED|nr:MFS transporter [Pseudomonas duriflava]TWI48974.1 putative MFS family arabinose efflux permease [Pseudomonas duriflava]